jgi:flavin-dependent dehydrogenase
VTQQAPHHGTSQPAPAAARPTSEADLGEFHTIVVGAGPAGVMAALEAAKAGPVLLAERAAMPRNKSCGGMLNDYAQRFLAEWGPVPPDLILDPEHVNFRYVDWDRRISKPTALTFVNVDRAGFDDWLVSLLPGNVMVVGRHELERFSDEGGQVVARFKTPDGPVTAAARFMIGGDGARSQTRRLLGVPNTANYVTLQDFVEHDGGLEPYFDCIYLRDVGDEFAYAYVVPKGDRAIVGSVFYPKTIRPGDKQDVVVERLRERLPSLGPALFREACVALSVRAPADIVPGRGRVLLAGEAGGFMSPTSGEGISYAMNTGREAGKAVAASLNGEAVAAYAASTAHVASNIRRKLRWLPFMESPAGKYLAGFVPTPIVSKVTEGL